MMYTVHIIVLLDGAFQFLDSLVCRGTFFCEARLKYELWLLGIQTHDS